MEHWEKHWPGLAFHCAIVRLLFYDLKAFAMIAMIRFWDTWWEGD